MLEQSKLENVPKPKIKPKKLMDNPFYALTIHRKYILPQNPKAIQAS